MAWTELDNSDQTVDIAGRGDQLYQRHKDGGIWVYTGPPLTGWKHLITAPGPVAQMVADDYGLLYVRETSGNIWRVNTSAPPLTWELLDDNPQAVELAADGDRLFQRHADGSIWAYTGPPLTGWEKVDGPNQTVQLATTAGVLFKLGSDGRISGYFSEWPLGWYEFSSDPGTVRIAAGGTSLCQLRSDGSILRLADTVSAWPPPSGSPAWVQLDDNPSTEDIIPGPGDHASNTLVQRHSDGSVWRYTGPPLTGWKRLDDDRRTVQVVSGGPDLYQRHELGSIWHWPGSL